MNRTTNLSLFNGSIELTAKCTLVITEQLRLEETSEGHRTQPPSPSSRLPRPTFRLLNISEGGDSTIIPGILWQHSTTSRYRKCFLMLRGTSCVLVCTLCLWSCPWAPLNSVWLCLLYTLTPGIYIHWWDPPKDFLSPGWTAPSALRLRRCSNPFISSVALWWTLSSVPVSVLYWEAQNWT